MSKPAWQYSDLEMKVSVAGLIGMVVLVVVMARDCSGSQSQRDSEIEVCKSLGVHYYRSIGSFPYLKHEPNVGRETIDLVTEKCVGNTHFYDFERKNVQ